MPLILPGNVASATASTTYDVDNSCRFFSDTSLHKDNGASSTNRDKYTFSFWYKKCANGVDQKIIMVSGSGTQGDGNDDYMQGYFKTDDTFRWQEYDTDLGSPSDELVTTQVFRDPSAWMHFVLRFDSTSGTADDRMRIYVNGTQVTAFGTRANPDQNIDGWFADDDAGIAIGGVSSQFCNGYLAEVVGVDGQSLAPTEFGEFSEDSPNIWIPKNVSGITLGNNGFYLDFKDSANLGNDAGGGTDFSEVNLAATDSSTDSPTNNFCTINPLLQESDTTLSEGNLNYSDSNSNFKGVTGTIAAKNGKWYAEMKITTVGSTGVGIVDPDQAAGAVAETPGSQSRGYSLSNERDVYNNNSIISGYTDWTGTYTDGDIIGVAMDLDNNKLYFSKGGAWSDGDGAWDSTTFDAAVGVVNITADYYYTFALSAYNGAGSLNFGSPSFSISSGNADANGYGNFEYAVPSGYYSLCTKNLAEYG